MPDLDLSAATQLTGNVIPVPFDNHRLDQLMEEARIDVLLVTSKHNVRYMLGGYRAHFFSFIDAMGVSRFPPVLVHPKGAMQKAAYIGDRTESHQLKVSPVWVPEVRNVASGSTDAMEHAVEHVKKLGLGAARIVIERPFLPLDATEALRTALPQAQLTTGTSLNRAPSEECWELGAPLSLDSGSNYEGYIGDLVRSTPWSDMSAQTCLIQYQRTP